MPRQLRHGILQQLHDNIDHNSIITKHSRWSFSRNSDIIIQAFMPDISWLAKNNLITHELCSLTKRQQSAKL